ncbi:hypothetical protein ACJJTC_012116 [Scirpophaga incertulas]
MEVLWWKNICDGTLNLPPSCPLPGSNTNMPYVFLDGGAFALSTHIMKPFSGHRLLVPAVLTENLLPLQSVPRRASINATQIKSNFMNYIYQSRLCSGRAYDA